MPYQMNKQCLSTPDPCQEIVVGVVSILLSQSDHLPTAVLRNQTGGSRLTDHDWITAVQYRTRPLVNYTRIPKA